jgi:hypothetical protein
MAGVNVVCQQPAEHFPNPKFRSATGSTVICLACYTPCIPLDDAPNILAGERFRGDSQRYGCAA